MAFQKLKAFGRRKSTGNVLEEPISDLPTPDVTPGESSFKVIPRNARKDVISFDSPLGLDNRFSHASSAQTRPGLDTASSSVRYSSTSTVPSSFEMDGRSSPMHQTAMGRNNQRSPELLAKPQPGSSFNPRKDSLNTNKPLPPANSSAIGPSRDRALTTSSYASTAVPPKLEAPLPALSDNSFDDLENMFDGLGERNGKAKADQSLPQPPQRTFQRADSEPLLTPRKPVGSASPQPHELPSVLRVGVSSTLASAEASPDFNRKSTDRLIFQNSSEPSTPGQPPAVPAHTMGLGGISLHPDLSSRQSLASGSSGEGKKSRVVSFHADAMDKPADGLLKPSSRGSDSSHTFNTSALAYAGEDNENAMRKMSQKDYEAMRERERYEDRLKLGRGENVDDEGPTIYEDLDDDEDERKREKRKREKQSADLAVNRQMMRKMIGRENIDPATTERRVSQPLAAVTPEDEDTHLLPYAHNLPPVTPADPKRLTISSNSSSNIPKVQSRTSLAQKSSGEDEDDDVPLGILQPHIMQKSAEVNQRISSAGSLMSGSASITPSHLGGASPNRLSAPDNRPKSRASNANHLPVFAQHLPPPDQLPFIPGFQGGASPGFAMNGAGGYFPQQPMNSGASVYGGAPATPGPIVYQDGFTGPYRAPAAAAGSNTLMDTIQHEERRKKDKYKLPQQGQGQYQRSMTMPNMQPFSQQPGMPPMPMMNPMMQQQMAMMQQMQIMQQQLAMMSGMQGNPMGMDPNQMQQMQQMQMGMQQMNMNGQQNGQRRPSSQAGNSLRPPTNFLGSLPAIPDASPIRASVLPVPDSGLPPGYAPSIAPSERSNIGMPSRYKPVTIANDNASVMGGRPSSPIMGGSTIGATSIRATLRPAHTQVTQVSDDDADNEGSGWGALRARRARNKQSITA